MTSIAAGDWNLASGEVGAVARAGGAEMLDGHHVDHAVVRNAKVVSLKNLGRNGSDHDALLYVLELPNGETFRLLIWNVYVGQNPDSVGAHLAALIDKHQPHAVALSEAYRCRQQLKAIAGYRLLQGRLNVGERRDCALLLRHDLTVVHRGVLRMKTRWIGPKHGQSKRPRRYPRSRVQTKRGAVVRLLAVHLPFGPAQDESKTRIAAWLRHK